MIDAKMTRAMLLLQQDRFQQAASGFREVLAEDPDFPFAHWGLGACLLRLDQLDEAQAEADRAIGLDPENSNNHHLLAAILLQRGRLTAARTAIDESLRLEPADADSRFISGRIYFQRSQWAPALEEAERGLVCDPENTSCVNLRAQCLVKLGRRNDASDSLESALRDNPEDADTHANQGWALLEAGRRDKALEHFRESLRLEPGHPWARDGIIETMKARSPLYRLVLAWVFWTSRFTPGTQWGIAVGSYLLQDFVARAARGAEFPWSLLFLLIRIGLGAFALLIWLASPLLNLTLLTDRFGRHALTRDERAGAWTVAIYLLSGVALLCGVFFSRNFLMVWAAVWVALSALPASMIFRCSAGKRRWSLAAVTATMTVMAVAPLVLYMLAVGKVVPEETVDSPIRFCMGNISYVFIGAQIYAMAMINTPEEQ